MLERLYERRRRSLAKIMESEDLDFFLLSESVDILYFTGFAGALKAFISKNGELTLYVSPVNLEEARRKLNEGEIKLVRHSEDLNREIATFILESKAKTIGFKGLKAADYLDLKESIGTSELKPKSDLVWRLRSVKDGYEIRAIKEASKLTSIGMEAAMNYIKPGVREYEIAAELEYAMRRNGADGTAFETIVASGERTALPHGGCTERRIRLGDLIMIDVGARYRNYCIDITRTFVVGTPTERQKELFDAVKLAQEHALKVLRAGIAAYKPDEEARSVLKRSGLEEKFVHGLGHGLGLEIHEPPLLKPGNKSPLRKGNVVTVEPGVYIPGLGGVRIEDTVQILELGTEKLTSFPIDFAV